MVARTDKPGRRWKPTAHPHRVAMDDCLTRTEIAGELAVTEETLARWESEKTGPLCFRIGTLVWYPIAAFKAWRLKEKEAPARTAREHHAR